MLACARGRGGETRGLKRFSLVQEDEPGGLRIFYRKGTDKIFLAHCENPVSRSIG